MTEKLASPAYPSLTAVLHAYVKQAPSGLDARTIADLVGKPYQTLMSELSRQEGHKLGADLLLPLPDAVQTDAPLEFPARQRGGVFVRIYTENISDSSLARGLAEIMLKASEFFAAFAERIKDGVIDSREPAAIASIHANARAPAAWNAHRLSMVLLLVGRIPVGEDRPAKMPAKRRPIAIKGAFDELPGNPAISEY